MLELNGASAGQSEPAEGKGGDRGRAPSGTKAVRGAVLTVKKTAKKQALSCGLKLFIAPSPANPPAPPPPQGCNYKSAPFLFRKKGGRHKEHSCQMCLFSKGLRAS